MQQFDNVFQNVDFEVTTDEILENVELTIVLTKEHGHPRLSELTGKLYFYYYEDSSIFYDEELIKLTTQEKNEIRKFYELLKYVLDKSNSITFDDIISDEIKFYCLATFPNNEQFDLNELLTKEEIALIEDIVIDHILDGKPYNVIVDDE